MFPPMQKHRLCYIPSASIVLTIVTAVATGLWWQWLNATLLDVRQVAGLIEVTPPHLFDVLPQVLLGTLIAVVVLMAAALAIAAWRMVQLRRLHATGAPARGAVVHLAAAAGHNTLTFLLVVWLALMLAVATVCAGGLLISARSTLDAAQTLQDVDPEIQTLISTAFGGAIDPKEGFVITVGNPPHDVDIGKTTCSLFCFVLARAMLADNTTCTCDSARMYQINTISTEAIRHHAVPAVVAVLVAFVAATGLLAAGVGSFARAATERRLHAALAAPLARRPGPGSASSDDVKGGGYGSSGVLVDGTGGGTP